MHEKENRRKAVMFGSLQEAYDRLDAIIENSYDGIFITDGQAVTIRINRAYREISGLSEEDVIGRSMWDMVKDGIVSRSGSLEALAQRRPVTLEQVFRNRKRVVITSTPVFSDTGEVVMIVTNVRDVTEFHDLQEKYLRNKEESDRYLTELEFNRRQVLAEADLIAQDARMLEIVRQAEKVASLDATVLLLGETGVGKGKIAKYIYKNSARRNRPFISINCGAIAPSLLESELFGYEKGAFTGAAKDGKIGLFEAADGGTVFLDEIGELPLDMQVKLLHVLQEHRFSRVGGVKPIDIDVRVVAATNRDLARMVEEKTFRQDLFYRLNVVPLMIPPLRERREDILPFAQSELAELNKKYNLNKRFTPDALDALLEYNWPGNVRELMNVVERVVIMSNSENIYRDDLPFSRQWNGGILAESDHPVDLKRLTEQFEYRYISEAYERCGNVRAAAASLGMDPATFVRKRKKYAGEE